MQDNRAKPLLAPTGILPLLRDLIHERSGIFFDADRLALMHERIEPLARAKACGSMLDYYYLLKYESNGMEDWGALMDALSVQETYFWREFGQIKTFVEHIVPNWFAKTQAPLRVWSAAAATGEEAYTIAMAVQEAGLGNLPIEILASDGSAAALEKARAGVYRDRSFRGFSETLRSRYFTRRGVEWELSPEIKRRVQFQRANLLQAEEISTLARCPAIFCRNVFIYFSPHAIRQTVATFASRMPRGGHLFVGASESLLKLTTDFELKEIGGAFVYVRI